MSKRIRNAVVAAAVVAGMVMTTHTGAAAGHTTVLASTLGEGLAFGERAAESVRYAATGKPSAEFVEAVTAARELESSLPQTVRVSATSTRPIKLQETMHLVNVACEVDDLLDTSGTKDWLGTQLQAQQAIQQRLSALRTQLPLADGYQAPVEDFSHRLLTTWTSDDPKVQFVGTMACQTADNYLSNHPD
jgi:hypothetical protein